MKRKKFLVKFRVLIIAFFIIGVLVGTFIGNFFPYSIKIDILKKTQPESILLSEPRNMISTKPQAETADPTNYSKLVETVIYNPSSTSWNTVGANKFKKAELLFLNGSFTKEIYDIPEQKLIGGFCVPYSYDSNSKVFVSLDRAHPRYDGYAGQNLDQQVSKKVLLSLLRSRGNITNGSNEIGRIFLCEFGNQEKLLVSEPSKLQINRNTYITLVNNDYTLASKIEIKVPDGGGSSDVFPIAYTTDKILFLKLQGSLEGGMYNLFKINFTNNSYKILYKGK